MLLKTRRTFHSVQPIKNEDKIRNVVNFFFFRNALRTPVQMQLMQVPMQLFSIALISLRIVQSCKNHVIHNDLGELVDFFSCRVFNANGLF